MVEIVVPHHPVVATLYRVVSTFPSFFSEPERVSSDHHSPWDQAALRARLCVIDVTSNPHSFQTRRESILTTTVHETRRPCVPGYAWLTSRATLPRDNSSFSHHTENHSEHCEKMSEFKHPTNTLVSSASRRRWKATDSTSLLRPIYSTSYYSQVFKSSTQEVKINTI